ncbi:MAG: 6-carboxytetrahydropterin synthase QueD [Spirochaetia bacterium]
MFEIRVIEGFAAAHFIRNYHGKCEKLHGHNYTVTVYAQGSQLDIGGMLIDFGIVKKALRKVLKTLDHGLINDIPFFAEKDPSAEYISLYIYQELKKDIPDAPISRVDVAETEKNIASYIPE